MDFPDMLKFLNRMAIRPVNDVTAQVTANVTATIDPEGMGVHMGPSVKPLTADEDTQGVQADAEQLLLSQNVTKAELKIVVKEVCDAMVSFSGMQSNSLVDVSTKFVDGLVTVHDSSLNVIVHKMAEMKQYVDGKVTDVDGKVTDVNGKVTALESRIEDRLALLENPKKRKKSSTSSKKICKNISCVNGKYMWRKTVGTTKGYKGLYKTINEAQQGLAQFCQEQLNSSPVMQD